MKARYLKLNHLRFIDALKRRGKLSLAAEEMNISQPAASRTLADIEGIVGQQICSRNAHGFLFNEFGNVLAARASRVVAEVENIGRDVREVADGLRGRVRIGAVTAAAVAHVLPASLALRTLAPNAQLQVDVEPSLTLMQRMRAGEYDFVLARLSAADDPGAYDVRPIGEEVLSFAVREKHPLADRTQLSFRDLSPFEWVIQPAGSPIWTTVVDAFRSERADFPERITYSASVLLTLATVSRTDAIAPFAREVANLLTAEDLSARIVTLDMARGVSVPAYNVILEKGVLLSPLAQRFLSLIEAEITRPIP
ncbi:LysR family transcriptional regulator [Ensifer sp. ENS07]|uniref:LysR family transcriptional regulator n=1 Tax=Ensifer sp. ENS07 TaxID=2769274 RepID=UPI00177E292E|nr:LysR family transcriptional regulator [Ensifer sp. ENS07]MBD9641367.1 LysR family transcriptional regulator [Ensifer sp. ENS07]